MLLGPSPNVSHSVKTMVIINLVADMNQDAQELQSKVNEKSFKTQLLARKMQC